MGLTTRQELVLQCVIDAKNEGRRPYTAGILSRMKAKGHDITLRQCSYDLGRIVSTPGTGVISIRYGSGRTLWVFEK